MCDDARVISVRRAMGSLSSIRNKCNLLGRVRAKTHRAGGWKLGGDEWVGS